ncbi:MAG: AAA family ATPase [Candidatus Sumerlaeota bacterium]|nr:AAA family ATPase [Candidatus Sumerlaeota bacterium]
MIKTITIENFLSFEKITIPLKPFNVFIGPNNAGKSNIFKAMKFLQIICSGVKFDEVFGGGAILERNFLYRGAKEKRMSFHLEFQPPHKKEIYEYTIALQATLTEIIKLEESLI